MDTARDLLEKGIGDWSVLGLRWIDNHDLVIELLPTDSKQIVCAQFTWVRGLIVNLDFGVYSGGPLIYGFSQSHGSAGLDIEFTFGGQPEGRISFQCNDFLINGEARRSGQ